MPQRAILDFYDGALCTLRLEITLLGLARTLRVHSDAQMLLNTYHAEAAVRWPLLVSSGFQCPVDTF